MTTTPPTTGRTTTEQAVADALEVVRRMIAAFGSTYPDDTTTDGRYPVRPAAQGFAAGANRGWTTSFRTGQLWLAWYPLVC